MSGFLPAPTFTPPVPPIPLGTDGKVLTMSGGVPQFLASSGGNLPAALAYASPAGSSNNVNPGGAFPTNVGRLVVTLAGDATWTGLVAGADGQLLWIYNADATDNLTLSVADVGSTAANRFAGFSSVIVPAQASVLACYFAGSVNRWVLS